MKNVMTLVSSTADNFEETILKSVSVRDEFAPLIIFIEPYGACISMLKHAIKNGMSVIIMTANHGLRKIDPDILKLAWLVIEVDTASVSAVMAVAPVLQRLFVVHAVIPGFEYFVPIAAQVADALRLPSIPLQRVMGLRNKHHMRQCLQQAGVAIPKFNYVDSIRALDAAIDEIGFPAIMKPVDSAGSVCVSKVSDRLEAQAVLNAFLNHSIELWGHNLSKGMLMEEYIDGTEFSVEGVIANGKVVPFSITEKYLSPAGDFVEIGHIVNPEMDAEMKEKLHYYVELVIRALGADNCPYHAEVRITEVGEPILMEIAARLAGDKIADLINLVASRSYFDEVLSVYLGVPIGDHIELQGAAGIRFFYRPLISQYQSVSGFAEVTGAAIVDKQLYYQPAQPIAAFPKALRRLGHVIIQSDDAHDLAYRLHKMDEQVDFIE